VAARLAQVGTRLGEACENEAGGDEIGGGGCQIGAGGDEIGGGGPQY